MPVFWEEMCLRLHKDGALGEGWLSYRCTASLAVAQLVKVLSEYKAKGLGLSQPTVAEWGCSAL